MKLLLLVLLFPMVATAAPFIVSDPTTQTVTGCGVQIDTAAKYDTTVVNKACHIDISKVAVGPHIIKATFFNVDPVWGRSESVFSAPLTFIRPVAAILTAPLGIALTPQ